MNEKQNTLSSPSQSSLDSEKKLDEVLDCLKGTLEQEGLVSLVRNIHKVLHDKEIGLMPRVIALETIQTKQRGLILGITTLGTIMGAVIGWCVQWFSHK